MAIFDEHTSASLINQFLATFDKEGLQLHSVIVGYLSGIDKRRYNSLHEYDTISKAVQSKSKSSKVGYWIEGRTGKEVLRAAVQESHCNIIILLKDTKEVLIFNPWNKLLFEPKRIVDISSPYLTRKVIQKLKVPKSYSFYYVFGKQQDDKLCRHHCKEFLKSWTDWKSYRYIKLSK